MFILSESILILFFACFSLLYIPQDCSTTNYYRFEMLIVCKMNVGTPSDSGLKLYDYFMVMTNSFYSHIKINV